MTAGEQTAYRLDNASEHTTCTVLKTGSVTSSGADSTIVYAPIVTVSHAVGGTRYVHTDEGVSDYDSASVGKETAAMIPGQSIPCRYVRGRPDLVAVFARRKTAGWTVAVGALLLLLPIGLYAMDRRKPRGRFR